MMKSLKRRSRGFTVVELVLVAGMVLVLASVAVPALQRSREMSRERKCQYNLKRIGLALHNYHDIYMMFPPGWIYGCRDASSQSAHGWLSALLPLMDQAPLYQKIDRHEPFGPPDQLSSLALEIFQCPASSAPEINALRGGYGNSNYSGNYGSQQIPRWTNGRMEEWWPGGTEVFAHHFADHEPLYGESKGPATVGRGRKGGVFRWNSGARIRDFSDGTSNTILVGERSVRSGSGIWIGMQSNRFENDLVTDASHWSGINRSMTGYSSEHGAGAMFGLADGSTRFLSESVESRPDNGIFQHLADMSDGEVIPPATWR